MLSDVVGEQVVRLRKRAGVTREQLAERCAAVGYPGLTVNVLGAIETGRPSKGERTREVTVDELAGLALALDVPPVILVADPREMSTVPLGGEDVEVWPALLWAIGMGTIRGANLGNYSNAAWLIHSAVSVVDAVPVLQRPRLSDEAGRAQADRVRIALERIRMQKAPQLGPDILPDDVRKRIADFDVHLPGEATP
jgi:transcriptional regulator with XRE-family HTH domain